MNGAELFRASFQNASVGMAMLGLNGDFLAVNPALCAILGYAEHELLRLDQRRITPPDFARQDLAVFQGLQDGSQPWFLIDKQYVRRDGNRVWTQVSGSLLSTAGMAPCIIAQIRDTGMERRARQENRIQGDRLRRLQAVAGGGFWEWDIRADYMHVAPGCFELLGKTAPGVPRLSDFSAHIHPEDQPGWNKTVQNLLEGQQARAELALRLSREDGLFRWYGVRMAAEHDSTGQPTMLFGTFEPRTAPRSPAGIQSAADDRFVKLFIHSGVGMAMANLEGVIVDANHAFHQLLGYADGSLRGLHFGDITHPDDRNLELSLAAPLIRGDTDSYQISKRYLRADGNSLWGLLTVTLVRDPDTGEPDCFVGQMQDIRREKEAEARAEQLAGFNSQIVAESPVGLMVFEEDGRCLLANPTARGLLGLATDQPPPGLSTLLLQLGQAPAQGPEGVGHPALRFEARLSVAGQIRWLDCVHSPFQSAGKRHCLLSLSDITARREAERCLLEAKQLAEEASVAKTSFLANMSHEIRTPMNAILGFAHLAQEVPELPSAAWDHLQRIETASRALLEVINDILDYARIEGGSLELGRERFNLEERVAATVRLFGPAAGQKGLELVVDLPPDVAASSAEGDVLRVGQVLNNLVGNAVKFTTHGHVLLRLRWLHDGGRLCIEVADTGPGIGNDQQARLFLPFMQVDASNTRRFGGTGLGLAITHDLVTLMGGSISVRSQLGAGSLFRVELPLTSYQDVARTGPLPTGTCLLVADNCTPAREALVEMLTGWGLKADQVHGTRLPGRGTGSCLGAIIDATLPVDKLPADIAGLPCIYMVHAHDRQALERRLGNTPRAVIIEKPVLPEPLFSALARLGGSRGGGEATRASPGRPLSGRNILLVEDNTINQQVAREMLSRRGAEVVVANNGEEALQALARQDFDVVLMDVQMPVMDGLEATRRLRANPLHQNLPVVAMTAAILPRDREECLAAGMNDHVAKPIDPRALVRTLEELLGPGKEG